MLLIFPHLKRVFDEEFLLQLMPSLIELMQDHSVIVRDSVAWTLGRICEILPQIAIERFLQPLVDALLAGLDSEPRVAANVCWVRNYILSCKNAEK